MIPRNNMSLGIDRHYFYKYEYHLPTCIFPINLRNFFGFDYFEIQLAHMCLIKKKSPPRAFVHL